jgi:hypothetical protein
LAVRRGAVGAGLAEADETDGKDRKGREGVVGLLMTKMSRHDAPIGNSDDLRSGKAHPSSSEPTQQVSILKQ